MKSFTEFCQFMHQTIAAVAQCYAALCRHDRQQWFRSVGIGADGVSTSWIDRQLEQCCLQELLRHPSISAVLSEEAGWVEGHRSGYWQAILDPLDGTSNAQLGLATFTLSLCLVDEAHQSRYAFVYHYATGDYYYAGHNSGAWCNESRLKVNGLRPSEQSMLLLARPLDSHDAVYYTNLLLRARRSRVISCPSLEICLVAAGGFDAAIDFHYQGGLIHTHDVIAADLILTEAGGALLNDKGGTLLLPMNCTDTFNFFAINCRNNFPLYSP